MSEGRTDPALFAALADPTRRRILEALASGPADIAGLARRLGLPRAQVAHHLGVLARAGLAVVSHRHAAARPGPLADLRRYYDEALTSAAISAPDD